ncbi:metallophosphoesterase [Gordonia sihwensis]|uniref:metallophosphoesterase n=1 Tax=Gordonia sihwensis TaxID=173559 RepID=UPI003D957575
MEYISSSLVTLADSDSPAISVMFGDWHGSGHFAVRALTRALLAFPQAQLYHVGDFGLSDSTYGQHYLDAVDAVLARYQQTISVIPGNHEQWPLLDLDVASIFDLDGTDTFGFMVSRRWPQVRICPRVNSWIRGGTTFAALSGANSIDFQLRTEGRSWWPEESPTSDHVSDLVALNDGRRVDVLLTHDAPSSAIDALVLYPDELNGTSGWSPEALAYARESAAVIEQARSQLMPALQFCGHHHIRRSALVDGTRVEILDSNQSGSIAKNAAVFSGDVVAPLIHPG